MKKVFVFGMSLLLLMMVAQAAVQDEYTHDECDAMAIGWTHDQCDEWNGLVGGVAVLPTSQVTHDEADMYGWTHDQADQWNGLIANGIPSAPTPVLVSAPVVTGGITHDEADGLGITHDEADMINKGVYYPKKAYTPYYYGSWYPYSYTPWYYSYFPWNCRYYTDPQCHDMGWSNAQCNAWNAQYGSYCYWFPYFSWW